jgi:predicted CxxxxCH...CXXCH cytochrome family protein
MVYRVGSRGGMLFFDYSSLTDVRVTGSRNLTAFIGSGSIGRSYLFQIENWWFLAPVSYYSQRSEWGVSPGYEPDQRMHYNRRVTEACLFCHSTGARAAAGTYNRFPDPPWTEAGISCERCHGPGEAHVKHQGPILNPAKLSAQRRDDVCAQCHLTGEERIEKPGMTLAGFRPGERLSDYADYFVTPGTAMRTTSHVERLNASRCKQSSGDRFWCGTCHDPHSTPAGPERVSYYRSKCLGCHAVRECKRGEDCAGCHMPRTTVIDAGHSMLTDHSIPRVPRRAQETATTELTQYGEIPASSRAVGLAYANLAIRTGDRRFLNQAIALLQHAESKDSAVLTRLAHAEEMRGQSDEAMKLYEGALRADRNQIVSAVNLGSLLARAGNLSRAVTLWRDVFERDPATTEAGINLAIALRRQGLGAEARSVLQRVLLFDPTSETARRLLGAESGN